MLLSTTQKRAGGISGGLLRLRDGDFDVRVFFVIATLEEERSNLVVVFVDDARKGISPELNPIGDIEPALRAVVEGRMDRDLSFERRCLPLAFRLPTVILLDRMALGRHVHWDASRICTRAGSIFGSHFSTMVRGISCIEARKKPTASGGL